MFFFNYIYIPKYIYFYNNNHVSVCLVQLLGLECLFHFFSKASLSFCNTFHMQCSEIEESIQKLHFCILDREVFLPKEQPFFCYHFQVVSIGFPESLARFPFIPMGCPERLRKSRSGTSLCAISSSYLKIREPTQCLLLLLTTQTRVVPLYHILLSI